MSILPDFGPDDRKRCFAYCGDERCNCGAAIESLILQAMRPTDEELSAPRFFPSRIGRQE